MIAETHTFSGNSSPLHSSMKCLCIHAQHIGNMELGSRCLGIVAMLRPHWDYRDGHRIFTKDRQKGIKETSPLFEETVRRHETLPRDGMVNQEKVYSSVLMHRLM